MKKIVISTLVFLLIISGFLLYSRFVSTTGLGVKEYKVESDKITDNYHGFKIVHVSDIHYGRTVKDKELRDLVNKINELKPDLVVLTGDLLDRDTVLTSEMTDSISNILKDIVVTTNKYVITGNHDVFFENWESIILSAGFININDSHDLIFYNGYDSISISGMSQNTKRLLSVEDKMRTIYEYLNSLKDGSDEDGNIIVNENKPIYNIFLMHEPDFIDDVDLSYFDLVLAGHTHNGQVRVPFIGALILPPNGRKYYDEYYNIDNTDLYISSGVGVSNVNFRFFNRPSINLYRLVKAS